MTTNAIQRRIYNPVQKDYVTFLETSRESGGKRSHCLLEVVPGGKVMPHYHNTYTETFIVRSGTLSLQLGSRKIELQAGEKATVPVNTLHAWSNADIEILVCDVILEPGHQGFEKALQAAYGMARDGLVNSNGLPKNIWHMALLFDMGEGKMAGNMRILNGIFGILARIARILGKHKDFEKYYLPA
jgi:mannose-6-phosphate isomerase-like protein (cupin superfamily)